MSPDVIARPVGRFVSRSWLGLAYGAILLITYALTLIVTSTQWDSISETISTNVHNMERHPLMVMIASAMVVDGPILMWGTLAVVCLIITQRWIGARWALLFAFLGNAVPTLVTMVTINYGLSVGWYDASVRTTDDYGVSYVVATLLGLLFWRIPTYRWRAAYLALGVVWLYTMGLLDIPQDFTALGHVTGYVFGFALGAIVAKYLARPTDAQSIPQAQALAANDDSLGMRDHQDA